MENLSSHDIQILVEEYNRKQVMSELKAKLKTQLEINNIKFGVVDYGDEEIKTVTLAQFDYKGKPYTYQMLYGFDVLRVGSQMIEISKRSDEEKILASCFKIRLSRF